MRLYTAAISLLIFCAASFAGKRVVVPSEYPTIQKAIHAATGGDTVFVLPGTYRENVTMADSIVLLGQNADKVTIRGNQRDPVVRAANWSTISCVTITMGSVGIISENTNMLIQSCIIRENQRTGIQCILSLPSIKNNVIAANGWSGIFCELVAYGTRTAIENNVIASNGYSGINLSRKSGVLVQNNVFTDNRQFGVWVSQDSRKSRLVYNDFWLNRKDYNSFAVVDATNMSKAPLFPPVAYVSFDALVRPDAPLYTMGKNGLPVGIVAPANVKKLYRDSDEDGIADEIDQCPDRAEDLDEYEDRDGCPEFDNDADGIYDANDACPDASEDFDGFKDQDGCPDPDNDGDGIPDAQDKCPGVAGTPTDAGCPQSR